MMKYFGDRVWGCFMLNEFLKAQKYDERGK